jgi:hypothetical protein
VANVICADKALVASMVRLVFPGGARTWSLEVCLGWWAPCLPSLVHPGGRGVQPERVMPWACAGRGGCSCSRQRLVISCLWGQSLSERLSRLLVHRNVQLGGV